MEFNPYPAGTVKHIPKEQLPKLNPEHRQHLELYLKRKQLETELKEINRLIDKREAELLQQINQGKVFSWCWKWVLTKTNISWKTELEKVIGKKKVQEIIAKIPATEYPHVGVEGYHPKPDTPIPIRKRFELKRK